MAAARSVADPSTSLSSKMVKSTMTPSAAAMSLGTSPGILTTRSFERARHSQARRKRDLDFCVHRTRCHLNSRWTERRRDTISRREKSDRLSPRRGASAPANLTRRSLSKVSRANPYSGIVFTHMSRSFGAIDVATTRVARVVSPSLWFLACARNRLKASSISQLVDWQIIPFACSMMTRLLSALFNWKFNALASREERC
jgi:hypothetical protein